MMRDAAREKYWIPGHLLFIDARGNCRQPRKLIPKNDHIIRAHQFDKFLMTLFDYTPSTEVYGFKNNTFNEYCKKTPQERQLVKVGRGGIFGGSVFALEYIIAVYDMALTAMLRKGVTSTEENIFSVLFYQVPQYIDAFSNNWACPDNIATDYACMDKQDQGYNCTIFE